MKINSKRCGGIINDELFHDVLTITSLDFHMIGVVKETFRT